MIFSGYDFLLNNTMRHKQFLFYHFAGMSFIILCDIRKTLF